MTLYHGSNVEVLEPKILTPNRGLDFGNGFYTTTNHDQAVAFAKRVTRNRGTGSATVSVYEIDEVTAFQVCNVVRFDGVCDAWLDFVCDNRDGAYATEQFYASRVYDELSDEGRKLWHYSPKVLFSMYDEEKRTGAITYPEEAF